MKLMQWLSDNWQTIVFIIGLLETILGALPNDKVPYRSIILLIGKKIFTYLDENVTKGVKKV